MANLHLVTGYAGQEHITAADQGALNIAIFGNVQAVLGKGNKLSASVITNNQIRIMDGEIIMQGRHIRLNEGSYVDLNIDNGEQGKKRNDLIVARYTRSNQNGVEECNLVVIKGASAYENAVDPVYTAGDIVEGHALVNDMPLYRVPLDGLNVGNLQRMFTVFEETMQNKQTKTNELAETNTVADGDFFPFYDVSANSHKKTKLLTVKDYFKTYFSGLYAPKSHNHKKVEITDFAHTHTKSNITDFAHTHTKANITDFAHNHSKNEITDLAAWAKASTKPKYTAAEVGAATKADVEANSIPYKLLKTESMTCTNVETSYTGFKKTVSVTVPAELQEMDEILAEVKIDYDITVRASSSGESRGVNVLLGKKTPVGLYTSATTAKTLKKTHVYRSIWSKQRDYDSENGERLISFIKPAYDTGGSPHDEIVAIRVNSTGVCTIGFDVQCCASGLKLTSNNTVFTISIYGRNLR